MRCFRGIYLLAKYSWVSSVSVTKIWWVSDRNLIAFHRKKELGQICVLNIVYCLISFMWPLEAEEGKFKRNSLLLSDSTRIFSASESGSLLLSSNIDKSLNYKQLGSGISYFGQAAVTIYERICLTINVQKTKVIFRCQTALWFLLYTSTMQPRQLTIPFLCRYW